MAKVIFYINGEKVEKNVAFDESENGNGSISFEVKEPTKGECSVEVGDAADENGNSISSDMLAEEIEMLDGTVISKNGKQFFKYGKEEVDITEDLADGKASGTIESSGEKYHYEVTEKEGNYSVSVKSEK